LEEVSPIAKVPKVTIFNLEESNVAKNDPPNQEKLEFIHGRLKYELHWPRASLGRATTLNRASSRSSLLVVLCAEVSERGRVSSKDEWPVTRILSFIKTQTTIVVPGPTLMDNLKAMLPNR
jgi:hypothetical protein